MAREGGSRDHPRLAGRRRPRRPQEEARRHRGAARPAHGRRPAAPLPAPLREDRRADQGRRAPRGRDAHRRRRDRSSSELNTYQDRRTGRPAYRRRRRRCSTDGPSLRMSFFAKNKHMARVAPAAGCRSAAAASSSARSAASANEWQLTNPQMVLFGDAGRGRRPAVAGRDRRVLPDLPAHQGRRLVGPPAGGRVRADGRRRRARPAARTTCATSTTCSTSAPRSSRSTRPARLRRDHQRPAAVPVRGGAGHPARARPAAPRGARARRPGPDRRPGRRCSRRSTRGCRSSSPAGQREIGAADRARPRPAAPDEPAAPGRGRLRQDAGRAAGDAAGRRLRRPGRAAGADRGARPAAPPLDHRDARRPRRRRDARRCRRRRPTSSC